VVVGDLYVIGVSFPPAKAHAPLVIDSDGVLAFAVSAESLEPVRRWYAKVIQIAGGVDSVEAHLCATLDVHREAPGVPAFEDPFGVPRERLDHAYILPPGVSIVKR
jgi:hypothetical protein